MEIDAVGVDDVDAITEQVQQMRQGAGSPPAEPTRPSSPYTPAEAEIVQAADATAKAAHGEYPPASEFELVPETFWKDAVDCETGAAGPKPEQGADARKARQDLYALLRRLSRGRSQKLISS